MVEPNSGRPKLYVKRDGAVCRVYMNTDNVLPMSLSDYNDTPVGGFPQTMSLADVTNQYSRTHEIVYYDAPHTKRVDKGPTPLKGEFAGEYAKIESENDRRKASQEEAAPVFKSARQTRREEVKQVLEGSILQDRAILEFRVMLAKYYANKADTECKTQVEAVASFILILWPDLNPALEDVVDSFEVPKFKL